MLLPAGPGISNVPYRTADRELMLMRMLVFAVSLLVSSLSPSRPLALSQCTTELTAASGNATRVVHSSGSLDGAAG